jgi:hypothetical protein
MPRLLFLLLLPLLAMPAAAQTLPYEFTSDTPSAKAAPAETPAEVPADTAPRAPSLEDKPAPGWSLTAAPAPIAPANPFLHDETRADAEARAQAMFDRMDLDHDGFVTLDEMSAFAAARAPKTAGATKVPAASAFVKEMFADADADHDGRISVAESKAAADRGFDETDTNHDGLVSPAERMAAAQDVTGNRPAKRKNDDVGR